MLASRLSFWFTIPAFFALAHAGMAQFLEPIGGPVTNWGALGCSADGTRLVAASFGNGNIFQNGGLIYVSTNAGVDWTPTSAPATNWGCVACSADGTKLIAGAGCWFFEGRTLINPGPLYISADAGGTWTKTSAPIASWHTVTSSADGTRLAAATYSGSPGGSGLWLSTNSGLSWTASSLPGGSAGIFSSADGARLAALGDSGTIYTSTNSGATFSQTTIAHAVWWCIAGSYDGTRLAVGAAYNSAPPSYTPIYASTNAGVNWNVTGAPSVVCLALASSADAGKLAAIYGGHVYFSTDFGASWTDCINPLLWWGGIALSADGTKLFVAANQNGPIYTLRPGPKLAISPLGQNLLLSWLPIAPATAWDQVPTPPPTSWFNKAST
jgi:hypothetical protein